MPLAAVVTGANENDGVQTGDVLRALVIRPEPPERPAEVEDERGRPTAHGDGAFRNAPSRRRAAEAGFRLRTPAPGRKGVGRVRQSVERCHNFLAQFGRVRVRLDRRRRRYLAWVEMAACVILIRSGFVR